MVVEPEASQKAAALANWRAKERAFQVKAVGEELGRQYLFIYLKRMHEVQRMVATWREIFVNRLFSETPRFLNQ